MGLMMKEVYPCKVVNFSTAKPGKHGSAKAMIVGKDIFTDKQYEETFGTGDMIPAPVVEKTEYVCIDVNEEGFLMLMTKEGDMKEDLQLECDKYEHLKGMDKQMKAIIEAA